MNEIPELSGMTSSVLSEVTVGVDDGLAQHLHIHKQPGLVRGAVSQLTKI